MNNKYLKKRQWTKLLESLDDGPNVIVFESIRDMESCRSTASYINMRSEDTVIRVNLHKQQLVGNFFKMPKQKSGEPMTQKDAILLESARYLPPEAFTDSYFSKFETNEGRRCAKLLLNTKLGEEKMKETINKKTAE